MYMVWFGMEKIISLELYSGSPFIILKYLCDMNFSDNF
jgi:hypothetical protein